MYPFVTRTHSANTEKTGSHVSKSRKSPVVSFYKNLGPLTEKSEKVQNYEAVRLVLLDAPQSARFYGHPSASSLDFGVETLKFCASVDLELPKCVDKVDSLRICPCHVRVKGFVAPIVGKDVCTSSRGVLKHVVQ